MYIYERECAQQRDVCATKQRMIMVCANWRAKKDEGRCQERGRNERGNEEGEERWLEHEFSTDV